MSAGRISCPSLKSSASARCRAQPGAGGAGLRLSPCRTRTSGRAESGSAGLSHPVLSRVGGLAPEALPLLLLL